MIRAGLGTRKLREIDRRITRKQDLERIPMNLVGSLSCGFIHQRI